MLCRYLLVQLKFYFLELPGIKKILLIHGCFFKLIFIGVQLLYCDVFITAVQQTASIICPHISPLFGISRPFRLPQSSE